MSFLSSRISFLLDRLLLLFRRVPNTLNLCALSFSPDRCESTRSAVYQGWPIENGSIDPLDWFPEELNYPGCRMRLPTLREVITVFFEKFMAIFLSDDALGRWDMFPGRWWAALLSGTLLCCAWHPRREPLHVVGYRRHVFNILTE